jgi:hypothetical protein
MHVYYEGALLFDSGSVSGNGTTNFSYGPGAATSVTIVMNEGGNTDTNTAWFYTVTSTHLTPLPLTFTERTNFASVPIKFAPVPLTNINYSAPGSSPARGIFYYPEQSLDAFVDKTQEMVTGTVRLKLYKGSCTPAGVKSPYSLYNEEFATFGEDAVYNQQDSEGFINLFGLPLTVRALMLKSLKKD